MPRIVKHATTEEDSPQKELTPLKDFTNVDDWSRSKLQNVCKQLSLKASGKVNLFRFII
jgi:hypothetical protein